MTSSAVAWPDELAWIVEALKREKLQTTLATRMDSGPPKRRLTSSPYEVFTGVVLMDDRTWRQLQQLGAQSPNKLFRVNAPDTGEAIVISLIEGRAEETTTVVGRGTTHKVRLTLRPLPFAG